MRIINLTQHKATQEQIEQGVFDMPEKYQEWLKDILTFESLPTKEEMDDRAHDLAMSAAMFDMLEDDLEAEEKGCELYPTHALVGGAPFFMSTLEKHLYAHGLIPLYAFSQRQSVEKVAEDGTVTKTNVFKHLGFIAAY